MNYPHLYLCISMEKLWGGWQCIGLQVQNRDEKKTERRDAMISTLPQLQMLSLSLTG